MITRFSASAWSTALIDFSRETDSGTMMNGKITRSFSGSTGRTSGILMASSFAVSFASVISSSRQGKPAEISAMAVPCQHQSEFVCRTLLQSVQLFHKGIDIFEAAVNRSKANIRHRIEAPKAFHH